MDSAFFLLLPNIVSGAFPISYSYNWTATFGEAPYNLIDTDPNCYYGNYCPFFYPGGEWSAFPNSEEKASMILQNMYRMFPNQSLDLKWGKWLYGSSTAVRAYYSTSGSYCGTSHPDTSPLYWYSDANTAARFRQYDEYTCDPDWYDESGISTHSTCNWVLDEYGGGSHCDYFSTDSSLSDSTRCSWGYRSGTFCNQDNCWFYSENICGTNTCIKDGHCENIFMPAMDYFGSGFYPGMNRITHVYSRYTDEIHRYMPLGAHFDERIKIASDDYNEHGKHLTLMVEWWDEWDNQTLEMCYSLYDGSYHEMEVGVSMSSDWNTSTSFSIDSYSSLLVNYFYPPEQTCEPYAFICKTEENNYYRLPEEDIYYFGTEWLDWVWTDYEGDYNLSCKENHYYNDGERWIVNGGPNLERCDIWYYTNTNYSQCLGCSKIAKLQCWETCIRSGFESSSCNCDNLQEDKDEYPYEWCPPTSEPSIAPTKYTPYPSTSPTTEDPTILPTMQPTQEQVGERTRTPTTQAPTTPIPTAAIEPTIAATSTLSMSSTEMDITDILETTNAIDTTSEPAFGIHETITSTSSIKSTEIDITDISETTDAFDTTYGMDSPLEFDETYTTDIADGIDNTNNIDTTTTNIIIQETETSVSQDECDDDDPWNIDCPDDKGDGCSIQFNVTLDFCIFNKKFGRRKIYSYFKQSYIYTINTLLSDYYGFCDEDALRIETYDISADTDEYRARGNRNPSRKDECEDIDDICGTNRNNKQYQLTLSMGFFCGSCNKLKNILNALKILISGDQFDTEWVSKCIDLSIDDDDICETGFGDDGIYMELSQASLAYRNEDGDIEEVIEVTNYASQNYGVVVFVIAFVVSLYSL